MDRSRRFMVWLVALIFVAALGTVAYLGGRTSPPPALTTRPAPDFRLSGFDGKEHALSDFKGRVVVLNFWASWCTPCKQEMPNLERAWKEFGHRGVVVLGIDVQDDMEEAAAFLIAFRITYPNVFDPGQERLLAYRVTGIPTTIFVDRDQRIQSRFAGGYLGESGYAHLRRQILTLLNDTP
ncbi:MAG: TlpA family protein disulfide reductase [bacterium]